mmetsp:Transcript_23135/g.65586  ORF Transcript_23135/g.65586 Transcript_23135/m.65586 type:complete len:202 (-) Transcript_23135:51-656(-)
MAQSAQALASASSGSMRGAAWGKRPCRPSSSAMGHSCVVASASSASARCLGASSSALANSAPCARCQKWGLSSPSVATARAAALSSRGPSSSMLRRSSSNTASPGAPLPGQGPSCESATMAPARPVGPSCGARCSSCSAVSRRRSAGWRSSREARRRATWTTCRSGSSPSAREALSARPPCQRAGGAWPARARAARAPRTS